MIWLIAHRELRDQVRHQDPEVMRLLNTTHLLTLTGSGGCGKTRLALEQLPPDYQEVVVLRNLQRLPFNEVAERMQRSRPATQMLWMRAIRKLQEALEEEEPAVQP